MSTAMSMIETFDAQMIDYPTDMDVPMNSSADAWFQEEAPMEDDAHYAPHEKVMYTDQETTIEVEMDTFQEQQDAEYEMTDGIETFEAHAQDIPDVEVYDASIMHTPAAAPIPEFEAISQSGPLEVSTTHVSTPLEAPSGPFLPSPLNFTSSFGNVPSDSSHPTSPYVAFQPSLDAPSQAPPDSETSQAHIPTQESAESSFNPHTSTESTTDTALPVQVAADQGHTDSATTTTDAQLSHPDSASAQVAADSSAQDVDAGGYHSVQQQADSQPESTENAEHHEQHGTTSAPDPPPGDEPDQPPDEAHPQLTEERDPHEISEGVYIDPPPPVLLALPMSERPDFSLFNRPSLAEYGALASHLSPEIETLPLLLEQRPTLYYEPLSTVLEVFRLQDDVMSAQGLDLEGELVLDAYELGMIISEDNVFAREVTLHELNVLHDAHRFRGPLRLRLRTVHPRFVTRYHWLQDNIGQLHIGEEQVTNNTDHAEHNQESNSLAEDPQTDSHQTGPELDQNLEEHSVHHEDNAESYPQDEAELESENVAPLEESAPHPSSNDHSNNEPEQDNQDIVEEDTEPSTIAVSTSEVLDADGIHQTVDTDAEAPVGASHTEYEEYAEPREDYEEEYPPLPDEDEQELEDPAFNSEALESAVSASTAAPLSETLVLRVNAEASDVDDSGAVVVPTDEHTASESFEVTAQDHDDAALPGGHDDPEADGSVNYLINGPTSKTDNVEIPSNLDVSSPNTSNAHLDATDANAEQYQSLNSASEAFPDAEWDDNLDGEGESDSTSTWDPEQDTFSLESSVTLSSKASKRSIEEANLEEDGFEEISSSRANSPGAKRPRTQ